MGIMNKMRERMTVIFAGLAGAFLLMIVFEWGAQGDFFRTRPQQGVIGEVNGYKITSGEYDNAFQQARAELLERLKKKTLNEGEEQQARDDAWDQVVGGKLTEEQMDKYGIIVNDQEVRDLLYNQPQILMNMGYIDRRTFTDSATGAFKQKEYFEALRDPRNDTFVANITNYLRGQLRRQKYSNLLNAILRTTTPELWDRYVIEHAKATAQVVVIKPKGVAQDYAKQVKDDEIKKYYDDHKSLFKQEAGKKIRLVLFQEIPTPKDSAVMYDRLEAFRQKLAALPLDEPDSVIQDMARDFTDEEVKPSHAIDPQELGAFPQSGELLVNAKPGDVYLGAIGGGFSLIRVKDIVDTGTPMVHARHILIAYDKYPSPDSAERAAKRILAQLKAGGNFAALAKQYSNDPGSGQNGGDLGWGSADMYVKEFKEAVIATPVGQTSGLVKTQFGYHIVEVLARTNRKLVGITINLQTKPSSTTLKIHEQQARLFRDKATKIGFEQAAKEMQLPMPPDQPIVRKNDPPLFGYKPFSNFILARSTGDITEPIKIPTAKVIVVVEVVEDIQKGARPLDDQVKMQILQTLAQRKWVESAEQTAKSLFAMVRPGESLDKLGALDSNYKPKLVTMGPAEGTMAFVTDYVVNNAAFTLKPGEISPLLKGENGWYIVQGMSVQPASREQFEKDKISLYQSFSEERQRRFFGEWFQKLKDAATIKDYRLGY